MRILNGYIARKLLLTTLGAVGVLTFVIVSGNLIRIFDLLARGVSGTVLLRICLYMLPVGLKFTLPLALLCAVVLVFSRLAADNELTAMRTSGIGLWQIISPALLLSILLSAGSFYLHMYLAPRCQWRLDQLKEAEGVRNPLAIIEAGRFVELPGYVIYVGSRETDRLRDIHVYGLGKNGKVLQDVTAREGRVELHEDRQQIQLHLIDAVVVAADPAAPDDPARLQRVAGQAITLPLDYGQYLNRRSLVRRPKHTTMPPLFGLIHAYNERGIDPTPLVLELHERMSMSLSPFAFLLIGIPFGIRTRRSEAAIGLVVSMLLATVFYVFVVLADNLRHSPQHHPELLVWIPNILYQAGGLLALRQFARR